MPSSQSRTDVRETLAVLAGLGEGAGIAVVARDGVQGAYWQPTLSSQVSAVHGLRSSQGLRTL
jgi:F0F1-type ATP synthase membrane subunit c/vacuolar-type H+-ATPase subunit K